MPKTDHLCLAYAQKKLNPQAKRPPRSSMIYGDDQGSSAPHSNHATQRSSRMVARFRAGSSFAAPWT